MLFIILCVVFVPFGFASIDTTCLPSKEVDALRVIGRTLGKKWDFNKDPCSWTRGIISKTYDDTVACTPGRNNTVCHVISVSLKGQSLPGTLPPEFANLPYLQNIDLTYNFLSGTIPPEWGSMEQLVNISLIGNRLTGSIPKELGNIRTLRAFIVDNNMMSGIIPQELGNLSSIERLCLVSNNFKGKLPASFANLTTMKDFRIDGNNFSGKIPNFIGGWTNLIILRIQASGLKGPIPPRITLLSNLTDLYVILHASSFLLTWYSSQSITVGLIKKNRRISDLGGPDTHCPPFSNGTSFKNLILRSCNLIGNLPDSLAPEALKVLLVV